MNPDERAELIAALHQTTSFAEALLEVNEKLVKALSGEGDPPSEADLAYMREGLATCAAHPKNGRRARGA